MALDTAAEVLMWPKERNAVRLLQWTRSERRIPRLRPRAASGVKKEDQHFGSHVRGKISQHG